MTDERLKFIAKQCLAMGKTELRTRNQLNGIIVSYHEGQGLHRMRSVERLIEARAGVDWLSNGRAKEVAFGILCLANSVMPADALVLVTAIDRYARLPAFDALPFEEQRRIVQEDPKNPLYFKPHDALMANAQTPERMCCCTQRLQGMLLVGEVHIDFWDQSEFEGRLKLFGSPPAELVEALKAGSGPVN